MPNISPYAKYKNTRVATVDRGTLLVMVYDAAIQCLKEAKSCMLAKDFSGKGIYLDRAFSAVNELRVSLNFDHDRKIADSLNQLYFFMTKQMSQATLKNDVQALDTVINLLKGLREAWEKAAEETKPKTSMKSAV